MNTTSRILHQIAINSNGKMRVEKVPPEKQPTSKSLARLSREISAQIAANDAMRYRSHINASKRV